MSSGDSRRIGGLLFVSLMFMGLGIGMAFDRPDVGVMLGMGIGFLAIAICRLYGVKVVGPPERRVSVRSIYGLSILSALGASLITIGVLLLLGLTAYLKYVLALASIAIGLIFLALALRIFGR